MTPGQALAALGIAGPELRGCATQAELTERLEGWQRGPLRQAYRALAKQHHPDRNPPEDAEACTARMAQVSTAYNYLAKLTAVLRRPQPQPVRVVIRQGTSWAASGDATSNSTTSAWGTGTWHATWTRTR